jgi:ZIP family zinc transporter
LFDEASRSLGADVQAFAGGAILAMVATAMTPEAYRFGARWAGITTVLGFAAALALTTI